MMKNTQGNAIIWILLLATGVFIFSMLVLLPQVALMPDPTPKQEPEPEPTPARASVETLASCDALSEIIGETAKSNRYFAEDFAIALSAPLSAPTIADSVELGSGSGGTADFTSTNVQVEGVDEADIVKTDGKYLYTLSGGTINIVNVFPTEDAGIEGTLKLENGQASSFFVSGDRLVVFGSRYIEFDAPKPAPGSSPPIFDSIPVDSVGRVAGPEVIEPDIYPWPGSGKQVAFAEIYDITERSSPTLARTLEFEGSFISSRLIGENVYVVAQSYPTYYPALDEGTQKPLTAETLVPSFRDGGDGDMRPIVGCSEVSYATPTVDSNYLTVASFPIGDSNAEVIKEVILGAGGTVYASRGSLYIVGTSYTGGAIIEQPSPLVPFVGRPDVVEYEPYKEEAVIHAFTLDNGLVEYRGNGRVPGHVLNQFSLDEFNGAFRIATTEGFTGRGVEGGGPASGVYLLDATSLVRLGAIEGIAPGETIFSARFLGERAYLVTFKKVDPLFVFDLADPANPKTLGKLKIPGFSDYLHPFNAEGTMIIGVGKNAEAEPEANFAWYQGMKLALFDATDPENPIELYKEDIGDRGTDSPALYDHKAFMFDASRNLLVIPITLAEISDEVKGNEPRRGSEYGEFVFQGAYVYELTKEDGFRLLARVTHLDDSDGYFKKTGFYPGYSDLFVRRNVRIGDTLWSISDGKVVASDLNDENLAAITEVRLSGSELVGRGFDFGEL